MTAVGQRPALFKDVVRDFGASGLDEGDDSAAFTAAIASLSAAGGGVLWVPNPAEAYRVANVPHLANVHVLHDTAVTYKMAANAGAGPACFRAGSSTAHYVDNIGFTGFGAITFDLNDQDTDLTRAYNIAGGIRWARFGHLIGDGIPPTAGNVVQIGTNTAGYVPQFIVFDMIESRNVRGIGSSCIQNTGCSDVLVRMLKCDGGVGQRLETDNQPYAIIDNCWVDMVVGNADSGFGNTLFTAEAHLGTIRNSGLRGGRATGGVHGCRINYIVGDDVQEEGITVGNMRVSEGGTAVSYHGTEDAHGRGFRFHDIVCWDATAQAFDIFPYAQYQNCWAYYAGSYGFISVPQPTTGATRSAHFFGGGAVACTTAGLYLSDLKRCTLTGFLAEDPLAGESPPANQLTTNEAGIESSAAGWTALANTTIAKSSAWAHAGSSSLELTATGNGFVSARTTRTGTGAIAVTPGTSYYAECWARAGTTTRYGNITLRWFTSAGAYISDSTGTAQHLTSSVDAFLNASAVAPATAAFALPFVSASAALTGEKFYYDDIVFRVGTGAVQLYGAYVGSGVELVIGEGSDLDNNGTARFFGPGTVKEVQPATVTS